MITLLINPELIKEYIIKAPYNIPSHFVLIGMTKYIYIFDSGKVNAYPKNMAKFM